MSAHAESSAPVGPNEESIPMSIAGKEALAGLQLLVAVAKADGELTPDDRGVIVEALAGAELPDGITAGALIGSSSDVDSLIAQIQAQDARDVAFAACLTMANANGACRPKQQAILEKIEAAWAVSAEKKSLVGRALVEARDTVWPAQLEPTADRAKRDAFVGT
jgi:tellurite resistance protein